MSLNDLTECPSQIPTIVNGILNENSNVKINQEENITPSHATTTLMNELSTSIEKIIKSQHNCSVKHKIILIGDSHIRGFANSLKSLLNSDYDLYCILKPGSWSDELLTSATEEINGLSHDDLVIVCSGSNDYELNNFSLTFRNIKKYLITNNHTNILVMNIPLRYDLPNSVSINKCISALNN